jgi:fumarate hydratase subunit beta
MQTPFSENDVRQLRAGDRVLLSGVVYTGRDAAHKRLCAMLDNGEALPVDLNGQAIYFVGPCPAPPGRPIGSAGPTTSGRMDFYSPRIIAECGLRAMIGKGDRSQAVKDAMKEFGCVYFAATGGAGALIANSIVKAEVVAFDDLGPEAIYKLELKDLPLVVAIDAQGNSLY